MKKLTVIALAFVLLVSLAACGADEKPLSIDEFDVYKSGKVVATPDDGAITLRKEDGNLETKRGIAVGNPFSDIARAYKDVPAYVLSDQREKDYAEQDGKLNGDLNAYLQAHPDRTVRCCMYELAYIDGAPVSQDELLDAYARMREGDGVEATEYALAFYESGGYVALITIEKYVTNKDNVPSLEEEMAAAAD